MLEKAIQLATQLHAGQKRKTGEEYITHPLAVMHILEGYGFCEEVLVCAVLHDVCEDCDMRNLDISDQFGERVGFIIDALSKIRRGKEKPAKDASDHLDKEPKVDYRFMLYIHKMHLGIIADPWIMFIKMADQIHNMSTLGFASTWQKKKKIYELEEYFLPMYKESKNMLSPMYLDKYEKLIQQRVDTMNEVKIQIKHEHVNE